MTDKPLTSLDVAEFILRRVLIVGVILLAMLLAGAWAITRYAKKPAEPPQTITFTVKRTTLTIILSDTYTLSLVGDVHEPNPTVLTLMTAKRYGTSPPFTFESTGEGEFTLITAIMGKKNEGGGPNARNWKFSVNGVDATASAAVTPIQPGDHVVWEFKPWTNGSNTTGQ